MRRVRFPLFLFFRFLALLMLLAGTAGESLRADVPVPRSVLHPASEAEAWNVIRLACANSQNLLGEKRLSEIPSQIALCNPALRALAKLSDNDAKLSAKIAEQTVLASVYVNSLAQSAAAGDAETTTQTLDYLSGTLEKLIPHYPKEVVYAEIHACPMHPDFISADAAVPCDKCGMPLNPRRIPSSFVYVKAGEPYTRLSATPAAPLEAGKPVKVLVRLSTGDGAPIPVEDLMVMHTQPIHLLIVDPSLQDYHHEHPTPTATAGEWQFTFTPRQSSSYRMFADVVPVATGVQEYAIADLPGTGPADAIPQPPNKFESIAGGLKFVLKFDTLDGGPPPPGDAVPMTVTVTDAESGEPVKGLMPVMNTFAHVVGFYEDYQNVLHIHPTGGDVLEPTLRGGPRIGFKFYAPHAGYLRLYCQVLVDDVMLFAPFDVNVLK